jgi:biotin synthase-related radical SAM superfamily protein
MDFSAEWAPIFTTFFQAQIRECFLTGDWKKVDVASIFKRSSKLQARIADICCVHVHGAHSLQQHHATF